MKNVEKKGQAEFKNEAQYKYGACIFIVKREYCGNKVIGEVLSNLIVKKETGISK